MNRRVPGSISGKLMLIVLATTFVALCAAGIALLFYDIQSYRSAWTNDLQTQADILGRASAPALQFNDPENARANLELLKARPQILAAAIYTAEGALFATYRDGSSPDGRQLAFPRYPEPNNYRIDGNQIAVFHRVMEGKETVGTVYVRARYELRERIASYLAILAGVLLASLTVAAVVARWLQATVTRPILAVSKVARDVMERRDFSLRAEKRSDDEVGVLVEAFNDMLREVEQRKSALEASYQTLERETRERRDAQEALILADRRKDEFLATLAHELRNPLAPISSGLEIMNMTGADSPASIRAREVMERQLRQMVRLVDDLIDVSRISTGKLVVRKEVVQLQDVVRNAVDIVKPLFETRKQVLQLELPGEPIYLNGDYTRLSQVFSNLLNNAARYTDAEGRIACSVTVEGTQAVIRVTDNGIGIPQDMLHTIFDMFAQVDRSLERSTAGLGVGLTLARRLVELHEGTIEARSPGINQGSTFIVRLPLAVGRHAEPAQAATPSGEVHAGPFRILIADDNVDYATSVARLLALEGHEVRLAHDGAEAFKATSDFTPQFAFLDIGLPGINGYDLARRLRAQASTATCVLVAVTGWGQEKDRQLAADAGFNAHLVKPVQFERIRAILARGVTKVQPTGE